ncbi:MAG: FxsB family cyclophane-forming radical SAM/SPASM peptide maturase [Actinoplanes sp.]
MGLSDLTVSPFRQFIVKVHGRCDLACDYCYVYFHADRSYARRPAAMSGAVIEQVAGRIAEHARGHRLERVRVVLHGGEPLLAGPAAIDRIARTIRAASRPHAEVDLVVQTNGVRLDRPFLQTLLAHEVQVGVSLDGGLPEHNRHRRYRDGRSSFERVVTALALLAEQEYRPIFGGILCTVDLRLDPLEVYRSLLAFGPPTIVLRQPHGNWAHPPPHHAPGPAGHLYGDWLATVFEDWYTAPRRPTAIRLFDSIIAMVLGGTSSTEQVGTTPACAVVIDTDGSIQAGDSLKTTVEGAPETGLNVGTHTFDEALDAPAIRAEQASRRVLPTPCRGCDVAGICGGGLHAHRYHPVDGFDQRSVYCPDLMYLIRHISGRVRADASARGVLLT